MQRKNKSYRQQFAHRASRRMKWTLRDGETCTTSGDTVSLVNQNETDAGRHTCDCRVQGMIANQGVGDVSPVVSVVTVP